MQDDAAGPKGSEFSEQLGPLPARWYVVSRDGLATLCASERNANEMVAECTRDYPRQAPYSAVLMGDVAAEMAALSGLADAVEHERNNADILLQQVQDQASEIERLRAALTELRDRIKEHPAYAELTESEEIDTGGDTAELSYLARVADEALGPNV